MGITIDRTSHLAGISDDYKKVSRRRREVILTQVSKGDNPCEGCQEVGVTGGVCPNTECPSWAENWEAYMVPPASMNMVPRKATISTSDEVRIMQGTAG